MNTLIDQNGRFQLAILLIICKKYFFLTELIRNQLQPSLPMLRSMEIKEVDMRGVVMVGFLGVFDR